MAHIFTKHLLFAASVDIKMVPPQLTYQSIFRLLFENRKASFKCSNESFRKIPIDQIYKLKDLSETETRNLDLLTNNCLDVSSKD